MNNATLRGRLTADPEIRNYTSFGPYYYWKGRCKRNLLQYGRAWIVERMSKSGYSKLLARI